MEDNAGIVHGNEQFLLKNEWGDSKYERGDWLTVAAFFFAERKVAQYRGLTLPCQVVPNRAQTPPRDVDAE